MLRPKALALAASLAQDGQSTAFPSSLFVFELSPLAKLWLAHLR